MFRWLLELLVTIILAMAVRAIFSSLLKGFTNVRNAPEQPRATPTPRENIKVAGELHKDPVCGMYVAESTRFQRRSGRESFYYCSEDCRGKHAVAAR